MMFGVVLWSDTQERKAVIWCEDHGDLAFYRQSGCTENLPLDAGDWVQFDLTLDRHMRLAHNPKLVSEGVCPGLADALSAVSPGPVNTLEKSSNSLERPTSVGKSDRRRSAEVIPFSTLGGRRQAGSSKAASHHQA